MTEGVTLYLLLWLLYLSECFVWISKRSLALVSNWNKQWQLRMPSSFIATCKGGAVLLNPLWPGTNVVRVSLSPISISPRGICAFNAQSFFDAGRPVQPPHHFAFEDIKICASQDRRVLVNTALFVECGDAAESQRTADLIHQAVRLSGPQRQQLIEKFIADRFEHREALGSFAALSKRLRPLKVLCSVFFPTLFILPPLMAFHYGLEEVIIPAALMMIGFAAAIAWLVWRQYKALWPALANERWSAAAKIIFCPPGAIRAAGDMTANFPMTCDPLVASALLPREERERFASAYLRDLSFPIKDGLDGAAKEVVDWYRAEVLRQATAYVKSQSDLRLDGTTPPVCETGCQSYCPRCHSQFTTESGDCAGCDGVRLMRPRPAAELESAKAVL